MVEKSTEDSASLQNAAQASNESEKVLTVGG